jgi:hypothetical protein
LEGGELARDARRAAMKAWVIFERIGEHNRDFVAAYRKVASAGVTKFDTRYRASSFNNLIVEGPEIGGGPRVINIIEFDSREIGLCGRGRAV